MKKILISILVFIIIVGGAFFIYKHFNNNNKSTKTQNNIPSSTQKEIINTKEELSYGIVKNLQSNDKIELGIAGNTYIADISETTIIPDGQKVEASDMVKINYTNTSENIIKISDLEIIPENTTENNSEVSDKKDYNQEYYVTGIVEEMSSDSITVKSIYLGNQTYTFSTKDLQTKLDLSKIIIGNQVRVIYKESPSETYVAIHIEQ